MRTTLITFALTILIARAFAQTDSVFYFNADAARIPKSDTAAFYRVIHHLTDKGFTFTEYRKDGSRVEATAAGTLTTWIYEGYVNRYYPNGKICEAHLYTNGKPVKTSRYHSNGTLLQTILYSQEYPGSRLIYEADSAGKENIISGNGARKEIANLHINNIIENITCEGTYQNGVKNGTWKGRDDKGIAFEEVFSNGIFVSGTSRTPNGKKHHYSRVIDYPSFKPSANVFEHYILTHLKNPADTALLSVSNRGVRHMRYTIDANGKPTNVAGFAGNTRVPLQLLNNNAKCAPARLRGVPVDYEVTDNYDFLVRNNFQLIFAQTSLKVEYKPAPATVKQ